jgi:hypothetical protein
MPERIKVNGHFRHYETGKVTYVRPQVRNKVAANSKK